MLLSLVNPLDSSGNAGSPPLGWVPGIEVGNRRGSDVRLEPRTAPEPVTAPEPLTADECTRRRARVVVPVAGGVVAGIVKLVGIYALLHPG